jgi:tetratricopeptide (TPR) repeat protein
LTCFLILAIGCAIWLVGPRLWTRLASARNLIASGLALGLGTLVWSGAAVLAGMFALWLVMRRGARVGTVLMVAGFLVPVLSSLTYNYLVTGDFIPVTASFGVNLYIGNNPASDGMDPFRFGEGNRARIEADRLRLSGKRRSDFFAGEAVKFIKGEPARWLRLEGRKLVISLSRAQINNNADIAERRAAWKHFFLPGLHFGIIFPLAAAGAVSAIRENRRALILIAGYVSFLVIPLIFFACERFRLPAIAMLVPLAAYGTEMVIRFAVRRAPTDLLVSLAVVAIAGLASNLDFLGLAKYEMPSIVANKAYVARLGGNGEEARRLALRALSLDPRTAGAYFQLGAIAQDGGRLTEALTYYLDCLEADPYFMAAYEAAATVLEAARINRSYLDAYVDDLMSGGDHAGARAKLISFVKVRAP